MIVLYVPTEFEKNVVRFTNQNGKIDELGHLLARAFRQPSASVWFVPGTMEEVQ